MDALEAWEIAKEKLQSQKIVIDALDCQDVFAFATSSRPLKDGEKVGGGVVCVEKITKKAYITSVTNRALFRNAKRLSTAIFNKTK